MNKSLISFTKRFFYWKIKNDALFIYCIFLHCKFLHFTFLRCVRLVYLSSIAGFHQWVPTGNDNMSHIPVRDCMWHRLLASQTLLSNQRVQPSTRVDPLFSLLPVLINKPDRHEIGQPLWAEQPIKHAAFSKAMPQFLCWHHGPGASNSGRGSTLWHTTAHLSWSEGGIHWRTRSQESCLPVSLDNYWQLMNTFLSVLYFREFAGSCVGKASL